MPKPNQGKGGGELGGREGACCLRDGGMDNCTVGGGADKHEGLRGGGLG